MSEESIKNVAKNVAKVTLEENSFDTFEKTLMEVKKEVGNLKVDDALSTWPGHHPPTYNLT